MEEGQSRIFILLFKEAEENGDTQESFIVCTSRVMAKRTKTSGTCIAQIISTQCTYSYVIQFLCGQFHR